jgi:hypothetical protein
LVSEAKGEVAVEVADVDAEVEVEVVDASLGGASSLGSDSSIADEPPARALASRALANALLNPDWDRCWTAGKPLSLPFALAVGRRGAPDGLRSKTEPTSDGESDIAFYFRGKEERRLRSGRRRGRKNRRRPCSLTFL